MSNKFIKKLYQVKEQMSVGAGVIAGMPTADPPEMTPVGKSKILRRKKLQNYLKRG